MKRLFLLGCLVFLLVDVMAYNPILVEGVVWQIEMEYKRTYSHIAEDGEWLDDGNLNTEYYKLDGDSIVDNRVYKKAYMAEYYRDEFRFYCLVREDVEAQKIWRYYDGGEVLIMDFTIEEGDTLGNYGVCEKIEYVRDKDFKRLKKITFEGGKNVWVEKYGFVHKDFSDKYYFLTWAREGRTVLIDFQDLRKVSQKVLLPEGVDLKNIEAKPYFDKINRNEDLKRRLKK